MRIFTSTTHEVELHDSDVFDVEAPASYSGKIVTARISRIRITRNADESLSWRLFGHKVKKDGLLSAVGFEYNQISDSEGFNVWVQIPGEIRASLPHSVEFARKYLGNLTG